MRTDRDPDRLTDEDILTVAIADTLPRLVQCCDDIPGTAPADRANCPACGRRWTPALVHAMYACPHTEIGPVDGTESGCQDCGLRYCTEQASGGNLVDPPDYCDEPATETGDGKFCDRHAARY